MPTHIPLTRFISRLKPIEWNRGFTQGMWFPHNWKRKPKHKTKRKPLCHIYSGRC